VLQSIARLLDGFARGKISRSSLRWLSGMVVSVGSTTELGVVVLLGGRCFASAVTRHLGPTWMHAFLLESCTKNMDG